MFDDAMRFTPPRWRATRWLTGTGRPVADDIGHALIASLFGTLPIFIGGVVNSLAVAFVVTARHPAPIFIAWAVGEALLCAVRMFVLATSRSAAKEGRRTLTDLYVWLGVAWAASIGFGVYITIGTGDWVASTLVCLSAGAMVGGVCFRNFGAPRMAALMITLALVPVAFASLSSGQAILLLVGLQIPFYLYSMGASAFRLNAMLVATMRAERDNDHRATHDMLTGLINRAGLERAFVARQRVAATRSHALFYLDLDDFKPVNDRLGHAAGDELLVGVGERLREAADSEDVVARLGGDEFVVLRWIDDADAARNFAEMLSRALSATPYAVADSNASIAASVGVAIGAEATLKPLLAAADAALYRAKSAGGGCRLSELRNAA